MTSQCALQAIEEYHVNGITLLNILGWMVRRYAAPMMIGESEFCRRAKGPLRMR